MERSAGRRRSRHVFGAALANVLSPRRRACARRAPAPCLAPIQPARPADPRAGRWRARRRSRSIARPVRARCASGWPSPSRSPTSATGWPSSSRGRLSGASTFGGPGTKVLAIRGNPEVGLAPEMLVAEQTRALVTDHCASQRDRPGASRSKAQSRYHCRPPDGRLDSTPLPRELCRGRGCSLLGRKETATRKGPACTSLSTTSTFATR